MQVLIIDLNIFLFQAFIFLGDETSTDSRRAFSERETERQEATQAIADIAACSGIPTPVRRAIFCGSGLLYFIVMN